MPERRHDYRREEDDETHTIVERAVGSSWLINRTFKFAKLVGAVLVIIAASNGVLGALNIRMIGTRDDVRSLRGEIARRDTVTNARIATNSQAIASMQKMQDSIVSLLTRMDNRMGRFELAYCLTIDRAVKPYICKE